MELHKNYLSLSRFSKISSHDLHFSSMNIHIKYIYIQSGNRPIYAMANKQKYKFVLSSQVAAFSLQLY